ncbi:diaminopropionate ammonia-lyase [Aureimonas fodinaquatilis]|uniref:Diaminopropionate ammonia-lyase n=1 Tax=Aureimonas fodinaquatilis TaxID=2565783 RepID=A0A5B0DRN3_9HYPH|nr:diaminopropionate ammonia-lyase [Aureimonas fodinaquatilis]KAA0969454.1 diaminopropionate ammonia-lyase [Aureimonas fodinaquatilis]
MPIQYLHNTLSTHAQPLEQTDAETLGLTAVERVFQVLTLRDNNAPTPLHALPGLAAELGLGSLHIKDEGFRLGLGSFKALGGAYALMILVKEEAERRLKRPVCVDELMSDEIGVIAAGMTFACATDGNHGRSVAQGASLIGAQAKIFVHSGVSDARIEAIASFGAEILRVDGNYDDSVAQATRAARDNGWTVLSDTSWPGYEYTPSLVSQGYIALVHETLADLPYPPTHVFLQAGVGGFAAAVAGHMSVVLGSHQPHVTIVEPARSACLFESAKAGTLVKVQGDQPTIMVMLECYEPSLVAFRILSRVADGFMTVDEECAPEVMRRLASPAAGDPAVVAGESGGAGLAGLIAVQRDPALAVQIGLGPEARVLVINTEGATDSTLYEKIVGRSPEGVLNANAA